MPCSIDQWITGNWHSCLFGGQYIGMPEPVFGLIVGGGLIMSFYIAGRSIATPTVLLILLSAIMIPVLPGAFVGVANGLAVVGIMAAVFALLQKYVMSPGV